MRRLEIIDGLRGYFLVFMMINHLTFVGGYWLLYANHNQLAFVEDAQGFIFLSGFLIGLISIRKMEKSGFGSAAGAIWRRARDLYVYVLAVLATMLVAIAVLPGAAQIWAPWIGDLSPTNPVRVLSAVLMIFQPTYMDILPQYIFYMLFAPFAVWLTLKGRGEWVLLASAILWVAAQLGAHKPLTGPVDELLRGEGQFGIRNHFNVLAWQIVFFVPLVFGALTAQNKIEWERIFAPSRSIIPIAALAFSLLFFPWRVATRHDLMSEQMLHQLMPFEVRADFGLVYLLNFIAVASGIAWLLIAGPRHRSQAVQAMASGFNWLMTRPFLRMLGRHSLQVYAWHVVVVYAVIYIDQRTPEFSQTTKTAIAIVAILLLAIPALLRDRDPRIGPNARRESRPAYRGG